MLSTKEIISIVETATGYTLDGVNRSKPTAVLYARYVAIVMMHEEGYAAKTIATEFNPNLNRTGIYSALKSISRLLEVNKEFKKMYLACIKEMADKEE